MDLEALRAARKQLVENRLLGVREFEYADGTRTQFRTEAEYRELLGDLDRQIAAAQGRQPIRQVRIASSKGL